MFQNAGKIRFESIISMTVWKLPNFSVIQILREIIVGESRVSKSTILTNLEVLNFELYEFSHFFEG